MPSSSPLKEDQPPKKPKRTPLTRVSVVHPEVNQGESRGEGRHGPKNRIPKQIRLWLERCELLGIQTRQLVWDLHVVQGHSQANTARLLEISPSRVNQCIAECKQELIERAPTTEDDFRFMREQVRARLMTTYEETFCRVEREIDGEIEIVELPASPQMLAVRLKCLDQLSKLFGLNLEREVGDGDVKPYQPPPGELATRIKAAALNLHGRSKDVIEARAALTLNRDGK